MKTQEFNNKKFIEASKGKGFYYICKETSEILSLMKPNSPKILKASKNNAGYLMLGFFSGDSRININIHRCMAETFIPNPNNLPYVNHIDGYKTNNSISNLEWCSASENAQHAHSTGLSSVEHCEKEVHQYFLNGSYCKSFKSLHEAARKEGISASNICNHIAGKFSTSGGKLWSYSKLDQVTPYTGAPIADYYKVNNDIVRTMKSLCAITGMSRASVHRRFSKHGDTFIEGEFTIQRILCQ